eukprot:jgi/Chlat1/956/Chrsp108S01430
MAMRGCLQFMLKLTNMALAMVGLAMIVYSLWMLRATQLKEAGGDGSGSATNNTLQNSTFDSSLLSWNWTLQPASAHFAPEPAPAPVPLPEPSPAPGPSAEPQSIPWFIYGFLAAGCLTFCVSTLGLIGAETGIMLAAQIGLAVAFYVDDSWTKKLPPDSSGQAAKTYKFITENLQIVRIVAVVLLALQVLSVCFALALRSTRPTGLEALEDEEDVETPRRTPLLQNNRPKAASGSSAERLPTERSPLMSSKSSPLASPAKTLPARGTQGRASKDEWTMRMREKYGLDTSQFTYPANGHQGSTSRSVRKESEGRCTVM